MKNKKSTIIAIAITVPAAILLGYGAYLWLRPLPTPPGQNATPKERLEFMASKDFKRLPISEQRKFLTENRPQRGARPEGERTQLTEEQRHQLRDNTREAREQMMNERLKNFFAMSEAERKAELQRMQKEMAERRQEMEKRRQAEAANGTAPTENRQRPTGDPQERIKERLANSTAENRALRTAMMKEMRRAGIQPSGRPPRS